MIIAISAKAGGGKTTLINGLKEQVCDQEKVHELNFADALKQVVLFAFIPNKWNLTIPDLADQNTKLLITPSGKTIRQLLQLIGTNQFRKLETNIWTRLYRQAYDLLSPDTWTFTADLRFPNELKTIHDLGGIVIRLLRDPNQTPCKHESEIALDFTTEATLHQYNKSDSRWTVFYRTCQKAMKGDFTHYWKFKQWNGEKFDFLIDNRTHTIEQTNLMVVKLLQTHFFAFRGI
jgi:hypothetical protein